MNSNNLAIIRIINTLRINDEFLVTCMRNILMTLAKNNVHMHAAHMKGVDSSMPYSLSRLAGDREKHVWVKPLVDIEQIYE